MNLITENEYRVFTKFRNKFNELVIEKVRQLSLIQHDIPPKGEISDYDFNEKNGKIFVQFEHYSCGETDYDQFYLPLEFLFDESYPGKYMLMWEEEKRKEKEEEDRKKRLEEENRKKVLEEYERKEYERLKLKFEKN